ncbi:hypothetical protein [Bacteroides acidifaciens]|uniref:hypothetical protein n=1 Tax=Bacteroides acidifaciens TaxID=85831 RepID=UPI00263B5FE0|nr:hypothetical protein [Bacteroides acidifaciens]
MILPQNIMFPFEVFLDLVIPGIDFMPIYSISLYGRIFNRETHNYLPQNVFYNKDKYITISLKMRDGSSQFFQMHRLMMMRFFPIENSEIYEVNHKDGIKYHNWIWNLEWATPSQNVQHALQNDLFVLGEDRENSTISNGLAHDICKALSDGKSCNQIAKELQFPDNCKPVQIISNIKSGLSWKHISSQYDFSNLYHKEPLLVEDQIRAICSYMQENGRNASTKDLLQCIGINYNSLDKETKSRYVGTISYMRKKKMYKHIVKDYDY